MDEVDFEAFCSRNKISEFRRMSLSEDEMKDYAIYEVLHSRMTSELRAIYNSHRPKAEFCDVLSEFYIYLQGDDIHHRYKKLEGIRSWDKLRPWMRTCFRNFLIDILKSEHTEADAAIAASRERMYNYSNERDRKIHCLAATIVSMCGITSPRDMFIFIRGLIEATDTGDD